MAPIGASGSAGGGDCRAGGLESRRTRGETLKPRHWPAVHDASAVDATSDAKKGDGEEGDAQRAPMTAALLLERAARLMRWVAMCAEDGGFK